MKNRNMEARKRESWMREREGGRQRRWEGRKCRKTKKRKVEIIREKGKGRNVL